MYLLEDIAGIAAAGVAAAVAAAFSPPLKIMKKIKRN